MKKKIINLAISVEADTRLRTLAVELNQPLGLVFEQAILAYQPNRNQDDPSWRESIEAWLTALELGKAESLVTPIKDNAMPDTRVEGVGLWGV